MAEIGQDLKSERLKQGLTLHDVFERTRISAGVITNLEEGNYDKIGTPLLVRSFMRTYCTALGIEPGPILDRHAAEIIACDRQMQGIKEYRRLSLTFSNRRRKWTTFLAALAIIVIGSIVAAAWIAQKRANFTLSQTVTKEIIPKEELPSDLPRNATVAQGPQQQTERTIPGLHADRKPIVVPEMRDLATSTRGEEMTSLPAGAPVMSPPAGEPPGGTGGSGLPNANQGKGHLLSAEASQEVWVQVKTDNAKALNFMMKPGEKREWAVDEKVQIVVGNAGGLSLQWDGKALPPIGKAGAVVRLQLPDPKFTD
jgi:cytoskeletal protein RodZ